MKHPRSSAVSLFLLLAPVGVLLAGAVSADTFFWTVPEAEWGAWHDPANWRIGNAEGEPAGRIPGPADRFFSEQTFRFDLGGRKAEIGGWSIGSWTQRHLYLRNGDLDVSGPWPIHGGLIEIGDGATLRFVPGAFFMPGASDAATRRVRILEHGTLDLTGADVSLFNASISIDAGGVAKFGARSWKSSWRAMNPIENHGNLSLPRGLAFNDGNQGGAAITLHPGSLTFIGGDLAGSGKGAEVDIRIEGGRIDITGDSAWHVAHGFVQTNATVEIDVPEGVIADLSALEWGPGTTLAKSGAGLLALGASRPAVVRTAESGGVVSPSDPAFARAAKLAELRKMEFTIEGDSANRTYFIFFPDRCTNFVKSVTYTFPQPETGDKSGLASVTTHLPYFHRRYPKGAPHTPFTVNAKVESVDGQTFSTNLVVNWNANPIGKPFPNEDVAIGMVSYGPGRERHEMVTNDLANLYVRWNAPAQLLPENANNEITPDWMEQAEKLNIRSMTIYAGTPAEMRDRIKAAWGPRYLGNNVGERTGFLYGSPKEMRGPQDVDLASAREWFLCRFMHGMQRNMVRGAPGQDPFFFSTSGASFAGYEMQGGVDYVCNELYAVGCNNIIYAQSEARGASRRWGPEWWCGWLAHEWQTFGIPYDTDKKYASLEAGMKGLWVLGTSLMCLESGSTGTQAHQYTWGVPEDRRKTGYSYDEDPPRRYRETIRKVHLWQKEHPRTAGTPDTSIALALGHLDSYIGYGVPPWAQHLNRFAHTNDTFDIWKPGQKINVWASSHPEENWNSTRAAVFSSCNTPNVSGTPHGQVDIIQLDDETLPSDLARYRLIAMGGWNTTTPLATRAALRWVADGGTLVMCAPQLLTRTDRRFLDYELGDLASAFPGIRFTGFTEIDAFLDNGPGCPENYRIRYGWPAAEGRPAKRGAWCGGKLRLVEFEETAVNDSRLGPVETVLLIGDKPLVIRRRIGQGWFYLMLTRDFPSVAPNVSGRVWTTLIEALADAVPQRVTLEPSDPEPSKDERRFFIFAAYPDKAYLLNLDWEKEHTVTVRFGGTGGLPATEPRTETVTLTPLEIREWPL